jgi:hypothetical protein
MTVFDDVFVAIAIAENPLLSGSERQLNLQLLLQQRQRPVPATSSVILSLLVPFPHLYKLCVRGTLYSSLYTISKHVCF